MPWDVKNGSLTRKMVFFLGFLQDYHPLIENAIFLWIKVKLYRKFEYKMGV